MSDEIHGQGKGAEAGAWERYVRALPMLGIVSSLGVLLMQFLLGKPWSVYSLLSNLAPLVSSLALFGVLALTRDKKGRRGHLTRGRLGIYVIMLVAIALLNLGLRHEKNVDVIEEGFDEVYRCIEESDDKVYVVFGSESCLYCQKMRDVYKRAFLRNEVRLFYYVDLMYEGQDNELIEKQDVFEIPALVVYHKGEEEKRLVGTATADQVSEFLN